MKKCEYCQTLTQHRYCSIRCNNVHYRQLHKEHRKQLLIEWRQLHKQPIYAICICCGKSFLSTRCSSKYCSKDCYNSIRCKNRAQLSAEEKYTINRRNYEKLRQNINRKIKANLRSRLGQAIRSNFKGGSAIKDLGCSIDQLKIYLESKFESWMSWDNWGKYNHTVLTWNIDHIVPLSKFDLTDPKQFKDACHYTNLQPLSAKANMIKKDR